MKLLCAVFAAATLLWTPARADEASKNAKIEEMMKLTNTDRMIQQTFDQVKAMASTQFNQMDMPAGEQKASREFEERILSLMQERFAKARPMLVKVYADTYTEEEVDGIVTFYKSPAGQAMLQKMPLLIQRSMAFSQQMVSDLMPEIQKMTKETAAKAHQTKQ